MRSVKVLRFLSYKVMDNILLSVIHLDVIWFRQQPSP